MNCEKCKSCPCREITNNKFQIPINMKTLFFIFTFSYLHIGKLAYYLINVISPFLVVLVPSKNSTSSVYAYTSIGCIAPLYFPSQPIFLSFVSNTFCPQRFQIMNLIFEIPKPLAKTTLLASPRCGVKAFGTSTNARTTALTGWQRVSAQPAEFIAIRQALKVPVALY